MDNIIIGIVGRETDIDNKAAMVFDKSYLRNFHDRCSCIGILTYDEEIDHSVLSLCDGIVLCGGVDVYPYHYEIVKFAMDNNIPILGICMGEQILGLYSNCQEDKDLVMVSKHLDTKHNVYFEEGSILYGLFGEKREVNSRHRFALGEVSSPFVVTARSDDGVIEGIEAIEDNFWALGCQWHPEDLEDMKQLFYFFLKECLVRKMKKCE